MKYLLSGAHGIGDCILILPVAKAIKEFDKDAFVKVITASDKHKARINHDIMSMQSYIDEFDYYSAREPLKSVSFLLKTMAQRFDYGVVLQNAITPHISSWAQKIARLSCHHTCGVKNEYCPHIRYDTYLDPKEVKGAKRDVIFVTALQKLGLDVHQIECINLFDNDKVKLYIPDNNIDYLRSTVGLVMGTNAVPFISERGTILSFAKRWPYENWLSLARTLVNDGFNVVLLGGLLERKEMDQMKLCTTIDHVYDFVGKLNIRESIALLSLADVVVGADTGLMHCAGALDKPSLTLFGCTDPNEYLPYGRYSEYLTAGASCSPCFGTPQSVTCPDFHCMSAITPDIVMNRIRQIFTKHYSR